LAHSFENIGQTEEALKAQRSVPGSGILNSPRPSHARARTPPGGRIEEAIDEFRKANELENAYYLAERIPPEYDGIGRII